MLARNVWNFDNDMSVYACVCSLLKYSSKIQGNCERSSSHRICSHSALSLSLSIYLSISPLVFYSSVSLKSDERCNHPDRSPRIASGRSSSRATIRRLAVAMRWTNSLGGSHIRGKRAILTRAPAAPVSSSQMHWIEFAEMVLHLRESQFTPRSREASSNVVRDIGFPRIATHTHLVSLEINSWNQHLKRDRR